MNNISWLEKWYKQNCNGIWEHSYGIEIGTLDNPGWYVNIDLRETNYANAHFIEVKDYRSEDDWITCSVVNSTFKGASDSLKLEVIIQTFRNWIEESSLDSYKV